MANPMRITGCGAVSQPRRAQEGLWRGADEVFRLKDLLKQQEAATQRAQEMLNTLEMRLGAAATAYPALVFYQLRHPVADRP